MSRSSVHEWKEGKGILGRGDRMCKKPETEEFMARLRRQKANEAGTWKIRENERNLEEKVRGK